MGQTNERSEKGKSARGTVDNAARLAALGAAKPTAVRRVDWDEASPQLIAAVVSGIVAADGAAMFGASRDGGAYMLTLYLGGSKRTLWFNGDAAIDEELEKVVAVIGSFQA